MALTLIKSDLPLKQMLTDLNPSVSHFNILNYLTRDLNNEDYSQLPTETGNAIVSVEELDKVITKNPMGRDAMGVSSIVRTKDSRFYHMKQLDIDQGLGNPMDFMGNMERLVGGMNGDYRAGIGSQGKEHIKTTGYIVNSGSGVHYYERGLLDEKGWAEWLENSRRMTEFVDSKWIELSAKRGFSTLRISSTKHKPYLPAVICKFSTE